jgi:hypothetical protein
MSQVKVRNLDHRDYVEEFRGEEIVIPAGGFVEMGRSEAVTFLGQMIPIVKDGGDRVLNPKMLKIEQDPEIFAEERGQPFRFSAPDGKEFRTTEGRENYMAKLQAEVISEKEMKDAKPRKRRSTAGAEST